MAPLKALLLCAAVTIVTAIPTPTHTHHDEAAPAPSVSRKPWMWNSNAVTEFPIHSSCNVTQHRQITQGLSETVELAAHARDHILRWGNESHIYRKYFGNRPSLEAIGAFDVVVNGDKGHVLFRCDDPDGNCKNNEGWAGHWRGENATDETVICDPSYISRRSLTTMCGQGYNVGEFDTNVFWASDLLHRLYHMPAFSQYWIGHFTESYDDIISAADNETTTTATHDSDTLQYFALEAYAYDIAVPGVGCPGPDHKKKLETSSLLPTAAVTQPPSTTSDIHPKSCHTHAGGEVHCV